MTTTIHGLPVHWREGRIDGLGPAGRKGRFTSDQGDSPFWICEYDQRYETLNGELADRTYELETNGHLITVRVEISPISDTTNLAPLALARTVLERKLEVLWPFLPDEYCTTNGGKIYGTAQPVLFRPTQIPVSLIAQRLGTDDESIEAQYETRRGCLNLEERRPIADAPEDLTALARFLGHHTDNHALQRHCERVTEQRRRFGGLGPRHQGSREQFLQLMGP